MVNLEKKEKKAKKNPKKPKSTQQFQTVLKNPTRTLPKRRGILQV